MSEIEISAENQEEALKKAEVRYNIPRDKFKVIEVSKSDEDTFEGASPLEVNVKLSVDKDYLSEVAISHTKKILELMGINAEVRSRVNGNIITVIISGEDSSILIGRDGQTLDALQYLLSRMVSRGGRGMPLLLVDVGGYRQNQLSKIEQLVQSSAQRVLRTKQKVILDPMSPEERKIIHNAINAYSGLKTYSVGVEGQRQVIIELVS